MTCPYHLILPSLIFIPNRSILTVPLMYSFLILSFLVTLIANLNIFISATSISSTCFFMTATVSSPYTNAGLTTELYTFLFTLASKLLSQITPDTFLHLLHPSCTILFTSLSKLPLSCTVDPKYLNSFTLGTFFCPPSSLFLGHFLHLRTDIWSLIYLLSSLFFLHSHTFTILVSGPLLPWSLRKSQYHHQTASLCGSLLISSVSLSIITANKNGLNANLWCSPTLTLKLSVVPTAHLTTVSLSSYISCTSRIYFSVILDFLIQYHNSSAELCRKLSLSLRTHNGALFDLPCTFPSTFLKQTLYRWFPSLA